jgi:hypothetical protein
LHTSPGSGTNTWNINIHRDRHDLDISHIILLTCDGRLAYHGPGDKALAHFARLGCVHSPPTASSSLLSAVYSMKDRENSSSLPLKFRVGLVCRYKCPMSYNPADWYLKQISVTPGADLDVSPHSLQ